MRVDSRCAQILVKLRDSGHPMTIRQLSDCFNVSQRTVRYDLKKIDDFLLDCSLPQLMRKPNSGIQVCLSQQDLVTLNKRLLGIGNYQYTLSPAERRQYILAELIANRSYVTIQELANKLCVSRNTVILDLKELRAQTKQYGIEILSKTKEGIQISGKEENIRKILMTIMSDHFDKETVVRDIQNQVLKHKGLGLEREFRNIFADIDIGFIEKCIQIAEQELNVQFSDTAYSGIVLHIAMALKRIQFGNDIVISKSELKTLTVTKEFAVASSVASMLEKHFNLDIPIDEIGYITVHMLGASSIQNSKEFINPKYEVLAQSLLGMMSKLTGEDLSGDKMLYRGLVEHIGPVVYRLQHGLQSRNPLLKEIETDYKELFCKTRASVSPIEIYSGKKMDADEVGYFVLHFAAALERADLTFKDEKVMNVLLVCSTGMGSAQILCTRIQMLFHVNIVNCIGVHHLEAFLFNHSIDLVISTIEISNLQIPTVVVNPLLKEKDIQRLRPYLGWKTRSIDADYQKIINIIENNCKVINHPGLEGELQKIFGERRRKVGEELMLKDVLTKEVIRIHVEVNNWEDAVYKCGDLLVKSGAAKESYVKAMIQSVKTIGPYIVIAPGIAMPHARPEAGAIRTGFSLITLQDPVLFGNKENDPVKIVVCICSADSSSHIKALSELVSLLGNEDNVKAIKEADSVDTILQLVQEKVKTE